MATAQETIEAIMRIYVVREYRFLWCAPRSAGRVGEVLSVARMKLWPGGTLEHEAGTSWCKIALPAGKKPNMYSPGVHSCHHRCARLN